MNEEMKTITDQDEPLCSRKEINCLLLPPGLLFICAISHPLDQGFQIFLWPCTPSVFQQMSMYP